MPDEQTITDTGRFKEELVKAGVFGDLRLGKARVACRSCGSYAWSTMRSAKQFRGFAWRIRQALFCAQYAQSHGANGAPGMISV